MAGTSIVRPHKLRERVETISILTEGATDAIYMGGLLAGEWIKRVKESDKPAYVRSFAVGTVTAYWRKAHRSGKSLPPFFQKETLPVLDETRARLATGIGEAAEVLGEMEAIHELGNVYTSLLPEATRTKAGVFYTPPPLTSRLLDMAETAGVNWATARVIDPACGGGAFLAPVCARKIPELRGLRPTEIIEHVETHLTGWEIDPFSAWLSQVFVEILLRDQPG